MRRKQRRQRDDRRAVVVIQFWPGATQEKGVHRHVLLLLEASEDGSTASMACFCIAFSVEVPVFALLGYYCLF